MPIRRSSRTKRGGGGGGTAAYNTTNHKKKKNLSSTRRKSMRRNKMSSRRLRAAFRGGVKTFKDLTADEKRNVSAHLPFGDQVALGKTSKAMHALDGPQLRKDGAALAPLTLQPFYFPTTIFQSTYLDLSLLERPFLDDRQGSVVNNRRGLEEKDGEVLAKAFATGQLSRINHLNLDGRRHDLESKHDFVKGFVNALAPDELSHIIFLSLAFNRIDDSSCTALANAFAKGALANLTDLDLSGNQIDVGCAALANACAEGRLAKLTTLKLSYNQISDVGLAALAKACRANKSALENLTSLDISLNQIRDAGCIAFANVCANGALKNLTFLALDRNEIDEAGCEALANACANGALPNCKGISLFGNPASQDAQQAVHDVLKSRFQR